MTGFGAELTEEERAELTEAGYLPEFVTAVTAYVPPRMTLRVLAPPRHRGTPFPDLEPLRIQESWAKTPPEETGRRRRNPLSPRNLEVPWWYVRDELSAVAAVAPVGESWPHGKIVAVAQRLAQLRRKFPDGRIRTRATWLHTLIRARTRRQSTPEHELPTVVEYLNTDPGPRELEYILALLRGNGTAEEILALTARGGLRTLIGQGVPAEWALASVRREGAR